MLLKQRFTTRRTTMLIMEMRLESSQILLRMLLNKAQNVTRTTKLVAP